MSRILFNFLISIAPAGSPLYPPAIRKDHLFVSLCLSCFLLCEVRTEGLASLHVSAGLGKQAGCGQPRRSGRKLAV